MKSIFIFFVLIVCAFNGTGQAEDSTGKKVCIDLIREKDDFTGEVKINIPYYVTHDMELMKVILKGKAVYYLSLYAYGTSYVPNEKGVIVIFTDGSKWSKPSAKIDVTFENPKNRYTAFVPMTQSDLVAFSSKSVAKYRLYIFDNEIEKTAADNFACFAKSIITAK